MVTATAWFDVDKKGLGKLVAGRSKAFVLYELLQNAWDQNVTQVKVTLTALPGQPITEIEIEDDDPDGFADLAHAYTLFAESGKKRDAQKRGRFNLGEKLVLALAREGSIWTTKGGVRFDAEGRHKITKTRPAGSVIRVRIPMTRAEHAEVYDAVFKVICPPGVKTIIQGQELPARKPVAVFESVLPTLVADNDGVMRRSERRTVVRVYEPAAEEPAMLFEMGIPVVETGDRFHVDVQQKVPLNMDRDNVTPAYLRALRVEVLNSTHKLLTKDDVTETWVKEACSDERVEDVAVRQAVTLRFGEGAVAYDPSDQEANKLSVADGRPLVYGGNLSGDEWVMVRRSRALLPAGDVTPSPKPYSPDGDPLNLIPESEWTYGMQQVAAYSKGVAHELLGCEIVVQIARESSWPYRATYGPGTLRFNMALLGAEFFGGITDEMNSLLIHEFGHHYESDHLSAKYYKALTDLGARFVRLALEDPQFFQSFFKREFE